MTFASDLLVEKPKTWTPSSTPMPKSDFTVVHLFCGIGGGSLGFTGARAEYAGRVGRFRTILAVDADPVAIHNYRLLTGQSEEVAQVMDLFSRAQYEAFHGATPPDSWKEVTPWDIWVAMGQQVPHCVFTSPPCKGFSGLLPEASAQTIKYQALNELTIRGFQLILDACRLYGDGSYPELIIMENVPRIKSRGKPLLQKIEQSLKKVGYLISSMDHDCGEIGELGQIRRRFLMVARHQNNTTSFLCKPTKKHHRTIGDVIGRLPLPGDVERGGPMHRIQNLEFKTWIRLALVPPGGDWRNLNSVDWQKYHIEHVPRAGAYGVAEWDKPSGTVTGAPGFGRSNAVQAVGDPRLDINGDGKTNLYRVQSFLEPASCVTGAVGPSNGATCISDPRLKEREGRHPGVLRIVKYDETAPTVTGTRFGSGALAISDPRVKTELMPDSYGVQDWNDTSKTIRANSRIMQSASSISDPRISDAPKYTNKWKVQEWDGVSTTITGMVDVQSGASSICDPRLNCSPRSGTMGVMRWDEPSKTVIGSLDVHAGSAAVADPRIPDDRERGVFVIIAEDGTWHRPLTTRENACLQDLPDLLPDGRPIQLEKCGDAKAREYIGNCVPPGSARAIAEAMLVVLMASSINDFVMGYEEIWVRPHADSDLEVMLQ